MNPPRDLNTQHLFTPPQRRADWEARARDLRRQILFAAGLWPMPERTPLNPRITGRTQLPDCVIENIALETLPGFWLCGNLYLPPNVPSFGGHGRFPAIANSHGHWAKGRLQREDEAPVAEPPPAKPGPGRADLVAIGVNLARAGFVVFAYDMVGYNDTNALSHNFAGKPEAWLWNISLLGLQLWNSLRVVDYLQSRPEVDKDRIGATGASGGGTQTFLLAAVDDRVKVSVPVNMVSAHMQGGCLCENGPGLRVGTDNVEITSLTAPRPQLMVSATGDWTRNNPTIEGPTVRRIYDLYGAGDKYAVKQFNYEHNYNRESREAMYSWFARHLKSQPTASLAERPFDVDFAAMRVFNDRIPMPTPHLDESGMIAARKAEMEKRLITLLPRSPRHLSRFRETFAPALRFALGIQTPASSRRKPGREPRAILILCAASERDRQGNLRSAFLARNYAPTILALSPLDVTRSSLWDNYFTTYNRTPLGDRVQTVLDALTDLSRRHSRIDVIGVGSVGPIALLARGAMANALGDTLGGIAADLAGLPIDDDAAYIPALYAPGLRAAGGLRTAALLTAPNPVCLHQTRNAASLKTLPATFRSIRTPLRLSATPLSPAEIADFLATR